VGQRVLTRHPDPPRPVAWKDMLEIYWPAIVYSYFGYPIVLGAVIARWNPRVFVFAAIVLGAWLIFRLAFLAFIMRSLRIGLKYTIGVDAIVVKVPRFRGDLRVQVDGRVMAAMELARNPARPKVGQHVTVLMNQDRSKILMLLG
jgi:hypothetical protein